MNENLTALKERAWKRLEAPNGLTSAELKYFVTMRYLSLCYQSEVMSAEAVKRDADKALRAYEQDAAGERLAKCFYDLYSKIDKAGTAYAECRTQDNADAFFRAVYGIKSKDCFKSAVADWEASSDKGG